jgi:hypothetical protein
MLLPMIREYQYTPFDTDEGIRPSMCGAGIDSPIPFAHYTRACIVVHRDTFNTDLCAGTLVG